MPQFKINGVDRETQLDTEVIVYADSAENARVKGKLKGIEVTSVVDLDAPSLPAIRGASTAVVEQAPSHVTIIHQAPQPQWNRGAAIVMSFLIPGLGQLYKGQIWRGLAWFIFTSMGYAAFVVPGLILHLFCILSAASGNPNRTSPVTRTIKR